jgi:hypothetical protein
VGASTRPDKKRWREEVRQLFLEYEDSLAFRIVGKNSLLQLP